MSSFAPVNASFEVYSDNRSTSAKAVGPITGSTFVKLVAGGTFQQPNVATCGAGEQAFGIAGYDAVDGEIFPVHQIGTHTVKAGTALTVPSQVQSDAAGKAVAVSTGKRLGQIEHDAALNADVAVRLSL